jgi:hypothetical protein
VKKSIVLVLRHKGGMGKRMQHIGTFLHNMASVDAIGRLAPVDCAAGTENVRDT